MAKTLKEWTVMVYLGGDNNLAEECLRSLKEIYRIGVSEHCAVVAQYDTPAGGIFRYDLDTIEQPIEVRGRATRARTHRTDDTDGSMGSHAVDVQGLRDRSASITALRNFVKDCIQAHPAKHYLLVLSGHAGGAVGRFLMTEDFPPNSYLSIRELGWAMKQIRQVCKRRGMGAERIDILGLDACAMSMVEVGYELKKNVNYMVGAEGLEPSSGWPYHRLLEELRDNPKIEPGALAEKIVEKYVSYYADFAVTGRSTDQAACNLDNHTKLFADIDRLAKLLIKKIDEPSIKDAIILAHWRSQSYKFEEYVDLWDFCDLLGGTGVDAAITSACDAVKDAIHVAEGEDASNNYVLKSCYSGAAYQHSRGVSIYFPWVLEPMSMRQYIRRLFFTKDTLWGGFVYKYVIVTRREPRGLREFLKTHAGESSSEHRIFTEHDKLFTEHVKVFTQHDKIFTQHDKIFTQHDKIFTQHDKIFTQHDKIFTQTDKIFTQTDKIFTQTDKGQMLTPKVKNPAIVSLKDECD